MQAKGIEALPKKAYFVNLILFKLFFEACVQCIYINKVELLLILKF